MSLENVTNGLPRFGWLFLAVALALAGPASQARAEDISAEEVRASIERGVAYLKSKQNKVEGNWAEFPGQPGGMTGLCTLALLNAGVDPKDEMIQKSLNFLRSLEKRTRVYSTSVITMAFVATDPSEDNPDKALIRRNAEYLASIQIAGGKGRVGTWSYPHESSPGDNSNTHFALLALHEATRVGVNTPDETWRLALEHWLATQGETGGWGYFKGQPETGSMTCAGITCVSIASRHLMLDDEVRQHSIERAISNGLAWMGRNFSATTNPRAIRVDADDDDPAKRPSRMWLTYYLCSAERASRLTGDPFFYDRRGKFNVYSMGAELLVRRGQDKATGRWQGTSPGEKDPLIATSLSIIFLTKNGEQPGMPAVDKGRE